MAGWLTGPRTLWIDEAAALSKDHGVVAGTRGALPETVTPHGPLSNVRVLDIASFMAAPMAAMWLGDFGADVVHVEHPAGDMIRTWGSQRDGVPLLWKMVGRNKRSMTLDLHVDAGKELLRRLVQKVDVVVENFRPGTLERWGIGIGDLMALNPRLIFLSISAYGRTGPYSPRAGFGTMAEAMSGYAHVTGQPDGPPTLPSFALADSINVGVRMRSAFKPGDSALSRARSSGSKGSWMPTRSRKSKRRQ